MAAYATFFSNEYGLDSEDFLARLGINERIVRNSGWTWWHQNVLVISDRPERLMRDAEGRLHCANGPSISYRDGWSLYHWHGIPIPAEWVSGSPPSAGEAIGWENVEQRRAACEMIGWNRVLDQLNAIEVDVDVDPQVGTLVEVDLPDSGRERFLRVLCGTGREFALPVPPDMRTALEANAWTYGIDAKKYLPEVRT